MFIYYPILAVVIFVLLIHAFNLYAANPRPGGDGASQWFDLWPRLQRHWSHHCEYDVITCTLHYVRTRQNNCIVHTVLHSIC